MRDVQKSIIFRFMVTVGALLLASCADSFADKENDKSIVGARLTNNEIGFDVNLAKKEIIGVINMLGEGKVESLSKIQMRKLDEYRKKHPDVEIGWSVDPPYTKFELSFLDAKGREVDTFSIKKQGKFINVKGDPESIKRLEKWFDQMRVKFSSFAKRAK